MFGARDTWWETESISSARANGTAPWVVGAPVPNKADELTSFAGAVYDINDAWSTYGSYAETFTPQSQKTVSGEVIAPAVGKQWEGGVKAELLGRRLLLSLAAYRISQINLAQRDPAFPDGAGGFFIASGEIRSEGIELEATGNLTAGWSLSAGYAYNKNEYEKDAVNQGQPVTLISPEHSLKLWTSYSVLDGRLSGWEIAGGVNLFSETTGNTGVNQVHQDGYAVATAQLVRQISEHWSAQLAVNNLFDEVYYARINNTRNGNYYGEPRNVRLTVRAKF